MDMPTPGVSQGCQNWVESWLGVLALLPLQPQILRSSAQDRGEREVRAGPCGVQRGEHQGRVALQPLLRPPEAPGGALASARANLGKQRARAPRAFLALFGRLSCLSLLTDLSCSGWCVGLAMAQRTFFVRFFEAIC